MPKKSSKFSVLLFFQQSKTITGKVLFFLANRGTKDQMEACGLELIGDQMKLLEVLNEMEQDISFKNHEPKKSTRSTEATQANATVLSKLDFSFTL